MAVAHEDSELPISQIGLAEIYLESSQIFPSRLASRPASSLVTVYGEKDAN